MNRFLLRKQNVIKLTATLLCTAFLFIIMRYYFTEFVTDDDTRQDLTQACEATLMKELGELFVRKELQTSKIRRIYSNDNTEFNEQLHCKAICQSMPIIPEHEHFMYKPVGNLTVDETSFQSYYGRISSVHRSSIPGGGWTFRDREKCDETIQDGVAIVAVMRDRWSQWEVVLSTLVPLLRRQRLCYRIFLIEQNGTDLFNRGMLFNVGFMEAVERFNFQCVVFHDADLAPINDLNPYGCDSATFARPIHLGVGLDSRNFKLNYPRLVGGVLKMTNRHFVRINGHSNLYWGWGQEDDDLERRLQVTRIGYAQMPPSVARYMAVPHAPQIKDGHPRRVHLNLLQTAAVRYTYDGLSSLEYKVIKVVEHELYTHILVDLGELPPFYKC